MEEVYPTHIPPGMQNRPKPTPRKRKPKPPASLSKLHRPLTRFYCNDCKKKFRSRILANRNNNAVQHYCSLYSKIITRKVDSHSNKCKGDHGMGPCVVKRTDVDPDSDGEDETKAAYYADKGKKPRATPSKRKLQDRGDTVTSSNYADQAPLPKRQRINNESVPTQDPYSYSYQAIPPGQHGYYHQDGYMTPHQHQLSHQQQNGYPPPPSSYTEYGYNGNHYPPLPEDYSNAPPMEDHNESSMPPPPPIIESRSSEIPETSMTPTAIPMPLSTEDTLKPDDNHIGNGANNQNGNDHINEEIPPPPPPLEEFQPLPISEEVTQEINANDHVQTNGVKNKEKDKEDISKETKNGKDKQKEDKNNKVNEVKKESNGHKQDKNGKKQKNKKNSSKSDDDCINISDDEDDIPELKMPSFTPSPKAKKAKEDKKHNGQRQNEDEDDDLILAPPQ